MTDRPTLARQTQESAKLLETLADVVAAAIAAGEELEAAAAIDMVRRELQMRRGGRIAAEDLEDMATAARGLRERAGSGG
jgi:hypothetical protein